jgi:hypothetical protein
MPYLTNSTPPGLGREATDAALLAALYAMRTYPDPVGASMNRELRDYIQNGYPATADRATCRLVTGVACGTTRWHSGRESARAPPAAGAQSHGTFRGAATGHPCTRA